MPGATKRICSSFLPSLTTLSQNASFKAHCRGAYQSDFRSSHRAFALVPKAFPLLLSLRTCSRRYPSFKPNYAKLVLRSMEVFIGLAMRRFRENRPLPCYNWVHCRFSFGHRCGEDTPYLMEPRRLCTLLLELCHAHNARCQNQQIASRIMLVDG